jgi:hypothetical protein
MKSKLFLLYFSLVFSVNAFAQTSYSKPVVHTYRLNQQKCTLKYQTWVSGVEYGDKRKCFFRITNTGTKAIKKLYITVDPSENSLNSSVRVIPVINPGQLIATWVFGNFEEGQNLPLTLLSFDGELDNPTNKPIEVIKQEQKEFNQEFEKIIFLSDKADGQGGSGSKQSAPSPPPGGAVYNYIKEIVRDQVTSPESRSKSRPPASSGVRG